MNRRTYLSLVGALGLSGCSGLPIVGGPGTAPLGEPDSSWTGASLCPDDDPPGTSSAGWERSLDEAALTEPSVAPGPDGEVLYVGGTEEDLRPGTSDAADSYTLYALSLADGSTVWETTLPAPLQRGPFVWNDDVYVGSGVPNLSGPANDVHRVDPASGEVLWTFDGTALRPLAGTEETVLVATESDEVGPRASTAYGLATDDGSERWQLETGNPLGGVSRRGVFVVAAHGGILALAPDTGERYWTVETDGFVYGPVVDEERVVYGDDDFVVAVGLETPTSEWRRQFDAPVRGVGRPFGSDADHVYVALGGGSLLALDPESGETRWTTGLGNGARRFCGRLYVDADGIVRALDPATGDLDWEYTQEAGSAFRVVPWHDTVFADASQPGGLYALAADDGSTRWAFEPEGYVGADVVGNTAYAVAGSTVHALDGLQESL